MTAILEAEATRLTEQQRLDLLKTAKERNKWGQFATPPILSLDIANYAWDKLKRRKGGFSFLDPAIGTGSFSPHSCKHSRKSGLKPQRGLSLTSLFPSRERFGTVRD